MTLKELATILTAVGYPIAYSHFKEEQQTPFICYRETMSDNFIADNKVYMKIPLVDIELYTDKKDLEAERKLESVLDQNEIGWQAIETFIPTENIYQRVYEIKLF